MFSGGRAGRRLTPFGARETGTRGTKRIAASGVYGDSPAIKKAVQRNGIGIKKEKQKVSAVERKQHLIVGISTEGSTISSDGSEFSINLSKFPLHVPPTAFNVGVRLVDLVVPYVWPNYNNNTDETLTIQFEDERSYTITEVGENVNGYLIPAPSTSSIGASANNYYAFSGASTIAGYPVVGSFDEDFTEGTSAVGHNITTALAISDANTTITGGENFVVQIVWEEKGDSGQNLVEEVIFTCYFFEVYRTVNVESGFQELYIRFSLDGGLTYQTGTRLSARYKFSETNVLTVIGDFDGDEDPDVIDVSVLYNDESVLIDEELEIGASRNSTAGHKWLSTTGMYIPTGGSNGVIIGFVHVAKGSITNMDPEDSTFSLGYVDDDTSGKHSFWYQHGILMNKFKEFELRPHIKLSVAGLSSGSNDSAGAVLTVPILHEDDTSLDFATIPTLLAYMQKVLNQFIFREFYMSQFLSVDLLENTAGNSGTNYLVQFDYELHRASSVDVLKSAFTMDKALYKDGANAFEMVLEPCPYYWYNYEGGHETLLTITFNSTAYNFDITDMDDQVLNPTHGDDATIDLHIVLSRDNVARFVYESIRQVLKSEDMYVPPPWAGRTSQPPDSCFEFIVDSTATRTIGIETSDSAPNDGNRAIESFAFKFKPLAEWVNNEGTTTAVTTFKINTSGLDNEVSETVGFTKNVFATYEGASTTFPGEFDVNTDTSSSSLLFNVFQDIDKLKMNITVEDGLYTLDSLNSYLEREINDFVQSGRHGKNGNSSLVNVRGDEFNQQAQIGALLGIEDASLPNNVTFTFPEQTFNAVTSIESSGTISGAANGTYFVDDLSGDESGENFQVEVIITGTNNATASIVYGGDSFVEDEVITVPSSSIGGGGDLTITVDSVSPKSYNAVAQMLFSGTKRSMGDGTGGEDYSTNGIAVTTTGEANGYSYCEFQGEAKTALLPKPSYDDENSQYIVLDYGRVIEDFKGIRHVLDPKDETTRIFTFDPFAGTAGDVDKNLQTNEYSITIPSGAYNSETLTEMIDYLLRQQNPEIIPNLIQVRELKSIQKLQLGCYLSSNPNNAFPHKVTFSKSTPTKFGALIGWDLEEDIVIEAPDYRETQTTVAPIYNAYFTNQHNFETRSIFLLSNFSRNATSPTGDPLQIVTAFAPRANRGENIIINPNQPIINDAGVYLKGDKLDEISFKLVDGVTKEPLAIGTEDNNAYTVVLALEYDEAKDQEEIMRPADYKGLATGI